MENMTRLTFRKGDWLAIGFVLVLAEGNVAEQYTDCVWLSVCREDTVEGLRQVRVCQSWTRSLEEWKS